jgi:hypothetical protein
LAFSEDFKAMEVKAEKLRVQLPLVKAMKMVLLDTDKSALEEIVNEVQKAGLRSSSDWLPELEGASLYERVEEEVKRVAAAKAKAAAEAKAKAEAEAKAKAEAEAKAKAEADLKAKAEAEAAATAGVANTAEAPKQDEPPPEAKPEEKAPSAPPVITVIDTAQQPPAVRSKQRKTITGLGPAAMARILHELSEAANEYDVKRLEELLTEAVTEGIAAKDLEPSKKVFEQLQSDAFLMQAVEEAKKAVEQARSEEDESNIDLVACRRLLNLSEQIRKLQGDEDIASSAVQKVQNIAVQQKKAEERKSVFELQNA